MSRQEKEPYCHRLHRCTMRAYLGWLRARNRLEAQRLGLCPLDFSELLRLQRRIEHFWEKYQRCVVATRYSSPPSC